MSMQRLVPLLSKKLHDRKTMTFTDSTIHTQFNGALSSVPAPTLGGHAIRAAISRSSVPPTLITDVYMGHVLQAHTGQAPARQASLSAGLSTAVEATTINKVCASGLKAVSIAAMKIQLGMAEAQVAGGMENMSRVPYYVPRASQQPAFGDQTMRDGLIGDGLWDVYNQIHMGNCAEKTARDYGVGRQEQDEYAVLSYERAQAAWKNGLFEDEVVSVTVKGKKGDVEVKEDEQYNKLKLDKVSTLKPAFDRSGNGTVTAANSSPLSDGASALVIANRELAKKYGKGSRVLARIVATADAAVDPIDFPIAPSKVVPIVLERAGITKEQVKVWEFNEAFAAVIKANAKVSFLEHSYLFWKKDQRLMTDYSTDRFWDSEWTMSIQEAERFLWDMRSAVPGLGFWLHCCISSRRASMDVRPFAMEAVRLRGLLCRWLTPMIFDTCQAEMMW